MFEFGYVLSTFFSYQYFCRELFPTYSLFSKIPGQLQDVIAAVEQTIIINGGKRVKCSHLYRPPDKSAYWKTTFFISHPKHTFKLMDMKIIAIVR